MKVIKSCHMLLSATSLFRATAGWQSSVRKSMLPRSASALFSTASTPAQDAKPIPITLLSGFLGTGKTSALKHLLENTRDIKVGVIVNDVGAVNVDAKLVANKSENGMIELQNGCACCSLADELFFSVESLLKDRQLDAIVVELSGVADPTAIRNNWLMAPDYVKNQADISRVVTVLDAASFGTDYMSWDEARERKGWLSEGEEMTPTGNRKVAELLAEQVEAADLILLNKIDLADGEDQIQVAQKVAEALNDKADLKRVTYGTIDPELVLGKLTTEKDVCNEPGCTDDSHEHSHSHSHDCAEPDCTDASHSHDHDHSCDDPACTDSSHSHSHDHTCDDPDCTDTTHSHSHDHATSIDSLGLVNFVFKSSRPFHPNRLMSVLNRWPVPVKDTLDLEYLKNAQEEGYEVGEEGNSGEDSPFLGVLRSKGFCWFAPNKWTGANSDPWRHDTAMYWSHAGKSFGLSSAGKWWATLDKDRMKSYFVGNPDEFDRIRRDDFVTEEFGDRRQEIVFIGVNLDEEKITSTLNDCLYSDEEMTKYRQQLTNYEQTVLSQSNSGLFNVGSIDHTEA